MNMTAILNNKFANEIDKEICRSSGYIEANEEFHKFVYKELPKEKAEQLDDLLGVLMGAMGDVYTEEGMKLGAKIVSSLLFGQVL